MGVFGEEFWRDFGEVLEKRFLGKKNGKPKLPKKGKRKDSGLHMFAHCFRKFAAFQQLSTVHQTFEIVSYGFSRNRAFHAFHDKIGRFEPAHMTKHQVSQSSYAIDLKVFIFAFD